MAKRLRHSRWRRLPGVYRFHERAAPDPGREPRRLSLFLPDGVLERAETRRAGFETVQAYCATLLEHAIQAQHDRDRIEDAEAKRGPLRGLDAIANDPDYLAEWSTSALAQERVDPADRGREGGPPGSSPVAEAPRSPVALAAPAERPAAAGAAAAEIVFRHAAVGAEDPGALLPALRRGEPIGPGPARELMQALSDLEAMLRTAPVLDRRLAYALHRLAFEGQILLTEAWPGAAADAATVDILRVIQESVDRVLSGEDIRYYAPGPAPQPPP